MIEANSSPSSNVTQFPAQPKKPPARRKSAMHGVRRSGLNLVPSKKVQKTKLATQEETPKLKFRSLKRDECRQRGRFDRRKVAFGSRSGHVDTDTYLNSVGC